LIPDSWLIAPGFPTPWLLAHSDLLVATGSSVSGSLAPGSLALGSLALGPLAPCS
jgi:hypothetical protein